MRFVLLMIALVACDEHGDRPADANPVEPSPQVLNVRWAISIGSTENDYLASAVLDPDGNVIATGQVGAVVSGNTRYTGFITKRSAVDGSEVWTRAFTPLDDNAQASGIAEADATGSIYYAASVYRRVDLGGQEIGAPDDTRAVLIRFDPSGVPVWIRPIAGLTFAPDVGAISVDDSGRAYIVGAERHPGDDQDMDSFLTAFDPDGTQVWTRHFSAVGWGPNTSSVAIAETGDVLIAGNFATPATIAGSTLQPTSNQTPFVGRFGRDGSEMGSRVLGGSNAAGQTLSVLHDRIFVQQLESNVAFLHALDANGTAEGWVKPLPGSRAITPQPRALTTTSSWVVSAGWDDAPYNSAQPSTVDGAMSVWFVGPDARVAETSTGARVLGGVNVTIVRAADANEHGYMFAGELGGAVDFGTGTLMDPGQEGSDIFLIKTATVPELGVTER